MDDLLLWQEMMMSHYPRKQELQDFKIIPNSLIDTFTDDELLATDLNDDMMIIYKDTDFQTDTNKMQISALENNFCVLFSANLIIHEILVSYTNSDADAKQNILDQLAIDFSRMSMHLNSEKCRNIDLFKKSIVKYKKYAHHIMGNLYDLIIMLSTQSSFYYPFKIVHDVYDLPDSNIHVISDSDRPNINIIDHNTSIDIIFKKTFKYIDIINKKILNRFYTLMILTIDVVTVLRYQI